MSQQMLFLQTQKNTDISFLASERHGSLAAAPFKLLLADDTKDASYYHMGFLYLWN